MASVLSIVHVIVFLCCVSSDCRADNDLGAGPQKGESSKEVWPGDEENMERRAARMRREDGEEVGDGSGVDHAAAAAKDKTMSGPRRIYRQRAGMKTVVGVVGYPAELECDVTPTKANDQLQLILWYKEGHSSPIYTFDARDKPSLTLAVHYTDDSVFGGRAMMHIPAGEGISFSKKYRQDGKERKKGARLIIDSLRPGDAGFYKCRTDFKKSPTRNYRLNMSILIPPQKPIIHDSNGHRVTSNLGPLREGEALEATCTTSGGKPSPRLSWWREHSLIDDSYEVLNDGATANGLRLEKVSRADFDAVFTCQAVNNNLSIPVSTSIRLDMTFPPEKVVVLGDRKKAFSAGREERLKCQCRGSRPMPVFRWFIGPRELDVRGGHMTVEHDPVDQVTTATIRFVPLAKDNGQYLACRATNEFFLGRPKEDGYVLDVKYVPAATLSFGPSLNPQNIKEGDDVYFECHVRSNPPTYNITWRHNGKFVVENVPGGVLVGNHTLVLQNVIRSHAGLYTCVASNQEGDAESNAQYLNVKFAPHCRQDQRLIYGATRQTEAEVSCFVDANPNPTRFRWQFQGIRKTVSGGGVKQRKMIDLPIDSFTMEHDHSVLRHSPGTFDADYGVAFCWAENIVGQQTQACKFKIVQESAPERLRNCKADNITWEAMLVTCVSGFDGGHEAQYHLEAYELPMSVLAHNVTSSDPRFDLRHLKAGQNYGYLLYASNVLGRGPTRRLNVSTMDLAEKRTAETRSKFAASKEEDAVGVSSDNDSASASAAAAAAAAGGTSGLALLPIAAILCGVAVGLSTVALGVTLLIKGRHGAGGGRDDSDGHGEGRCSTSVSASSRDEGRGKYGVVATTDDDDSVISGEKQIRRGAYDKQPPTPMHPATMEAFKGLASSSAPPYSGGGSLDRRHNDGKKLEQQHQGRRQNNTLQHQSRKVRRGGNKELESPSSTSSGERSLGRPYQQRSVHFHPGLEAPSGRTTQTLTREMPSHSCQQQQQQQQHNLQGDLQLLDNTLPMPLLPPDTFSDSPPGSSSSENNRSRQASRLHGAATTTATMQQLRVQAMARRSTGASGNDDMESSFVTFCPPTLETKTRDIVNATRL